VFDLALAICASVGLAVIYIQSIVPLVEPPAPVPHAVALEWAGLQLRGYTETVYINATTCGGPAFVLLDLYRTGVAPEPEYTQTLTRGRVAFSITGDQTTTYRDVRVWESDAGAGVANTLLNRTRAHLPAATPITWQETRERSPSRRLAIAFRFHWDPIAKPSLDVALQARWISNRVAGDSCWLAIPALLGGGEAEVAANRAIDTEELTRGPLGQPLYNASVVVNGQPDPKLRVDPADSIPTPTGIAPATWSCGGLHFSSADCQAFAVLATSRGEHARTRDLALWSVAAGLLIALLAECVIGLLRRLILGSASASS
jgi:hypothetical protein